VSTFIGYRTPENPETGTDRKKGPERTEVATPESLPDDSKGQDDNKKEEDEEINFEQR